MEGEFISILSPHYEPLQCPIFFPHGTHGWSPDGEPKISQIKRYRYLLCQEEARFLPLGRLTNEYLVDMFSRVEDERFAFLRRESINRAGGEKNIDIRMSSRMPGSRA